MGFFRKLGLSRQEALPDWVPRSTGALVSQSTTRYPIPMDSTDSFARPSSSVHADPTQHENAPLTETPPAPSAPGSVVRRLLALLVDGMLMSVVTLVGLLVLALVAPTVAGEEWKNISLESLRKLSGVVVIVNLLGIGLLALCESSGAQATPGKILMRLRVERSNGGRAAYEQIIKRNALKYVLSLVQVLGSAILGAAGLIGVVVYFGGLLAALVFHVLDFIFTVAHPQRVSLHCRMSNTRVVQEGSFPYGGALGVFALFLGFLALGALLPESPEQNSKRKIRLTPSRSVPALDASAVQAPQAPMTPAAPSPVEKGAEPEEVPALGFSGQVVIGGATYDLSSPKVTYDPQSKTFRLHADLQQGGGSFEAVLRFKPFQRLCEKFAVRSITVTIEQQGRRHTFERNPTLKEQDDLHKLRCAFRVPSSFDTTIKGEAGAVRWELVLLNYQIS